MITLILRIQSYTPDGPKGTAESPGGERRVFRDGRELLDLIATWAENADQDGNGSGSISSSAIRDT